MTFVAGIDVSGKTAHICLLDPEDQAHPYFWVFEPSDRKKVGHVECCRRLAHWARFFWARWREDVVVCWIEEARGANSRAIFQLSLLSGVLLASIPDEVAVEFVPAVECRKLNQIPGNAAKSECLEWANLETSVTTCNNDHFADSYIVARAILAHGSNRGAPDAVGIPDYP